MGIPTKYPIDDMPNLVKRLGKAKTARIRYAQQGTGRRQPSAKNVINPVIEDIAMLKPGDRHPVNDILQCFASLGDSERSLDPKCLLAILQCVPILNTRELQRMFNISDRQARKYLQITLAALTFISRELNDKTKGNNHGNTKN